MHKGTTLAVTGALLLAGALPLLAADSAQAATSGDTIGFGMDADSIDLQQGAGIAPTYGLFWVGAWNQNHGWDGIENWLRKCKAEGVTPVIQWYYWGDDISPHNVENGVWSDMAGTHKTKDGWWSMTHTLGQKIRDIMGDSEAVVILESEFNKNGVDASWYAPTFDSYLADHARILRSYDPNTKIVIGFGNWGQENWGRFPKAIGTSDYLGFQTMRGSTRDSYSHYMSAVDEIKSASHHLHSKYNKPTFLYDLALSSYPEMEYAYHQEKMIQELFQRKEELRNAGLRAIVYRTWFDQPNFDLRNYYGYAERHWGLVRADWSHKPAFDDWVNGVKAEMNRQPSSSGGSTSGGSSGGSGGNPGANWDWYMEAEKFQTKTAGGWQSDGSANGGAAWNLWSNGKIVEGVKVPKKGMYAVKIQAKGTPYKGEYPIMKLYKNGGHVQSWRVGPGWNGYWTLMHMEGTWSIKVAIEFPNDAAGGGEDRNLIIDYVGMNRVPWQWEQAEHFDKHTAGAKHRDWSASNDWAWGFWGKGHMTDTFWAPAPGWYHIGIHAAGKGSCGNPARMYLKVDGDWKSAWKVDPGYEPYHKWVWLDRGNHDLTVGFPNPCKAQRVLFVDRVSFSAT